jgi:hypothetical protein
VNEGAPAVSIVGYRLVPPDQLLAHPSNPRRHPNAQREALRASLRALGWIAPVVQNVRTGHLIDGHARIEEALSAGVAEVPVIDVDLSPEQEALALATFDPITALAVLDREVLDSLLRDVSTDETALQSLLADVAQSAGLEYGATADVADVPAQLDRAAELQAQWGTERGQLWVIPSATVPGQAHRLLCGDSTDAGDVARLMDGAQAQLYAMLTQGYFAAAAAAGLLISRQIIWCKPQFIFGRGEYHWQHELCFYGWRQGHRPPWYGSRNQTTVWSFGYDGNRNDRDHPTQKPAECFAIPMRNHTQQGQVCAEPFSGSGTQFLAAEQTGRLCYGMELEPKYVAVALQRLSDMSLHPERADA